MKDVFQKELQVSKPELIRHFKTAIARGSTFEESLLAMFHFFAESMPLDYISVTSQNRHGLRFHRCRQHQTGIFRTSR